MNKINVCMRNAPSKTKTFGISAKPFHLATMFLTPSCTRHVSRLTPVGHKMLPGYIGGPQLAYWVRP